VEWPGLPSLREWNLRKDLKEVKGESSGEEAFQIKEKQEAGTQKVYSMCKVKPALARSLEDGNSLV
jgi:hypothetical protein